MGMLRGRPFDGDVNGVWLKIADTKAKSKSKSKTPA
jgi:hypothetical protein